MTRALIGHTGFVGSNLARQYAFDAGFNSTNFRDLAGQRFDEVVCAGVSAIKWLANKEPASDRARIRELEEVLDTVTARSFVLISTIDVYPRTTGVDESFDCHSLPNHSYGSHRLAFEEFCTGHFPECLVVRLPGLFGPGLKKNVIYDLLHDNCLEMINDASSFQYYPLVRLWTDIERARAAGLRLINLFTEPVATSDIIARHFVGKKVGSKAGPEAHYDLHTCHARHWGKTGPYVYSRSEVMDELAAFVAAPEAAP